MQDKSGPILLRNTMAFAPKDTDAFKDAIAAAVEFADEYGPQLMVQAYIDEQQGRCYSFQLFPDSDAILRHWQISDPNIASVMRYCTVHSLEVYGSPSQAVRDELRATAGTASVWSAPEYVGFLRLDSRKQDRRTRRTILIS